MLTREPGVLRHCHARVAIAPDEGIRQFVVQVCPKRSPGGATACSPGQGPREHSEPGRSPGLSVRSLAAAERLGRLRSADVRGRNRPRIGCVLGRTPIAAAPNARTRCFANLNPGAAPAYCGLAPGYTTWPLRGHFEGATRGGNYRIPSRLRGHADKRTRPPQPLPRKRGNGTGRLARWRTN